MRLSKQLLLSKLNKFQFIKGKEKYEISIIDDVFPYYISPWRNLEYIFLANNFKTKIFCDKPQLNKYIPGHNSFEKLSKDFESAFPEQKIDYSELKLLSKVNTKIFYFLFYGYLVKYLKHCYRHNIPFVFNLYPGGGFDLYNKDVVDFLKKTTKNKLFKGVIVNQKVINNYLLENKITTEEKILNSIGFTVADDFNKKYDHSGKIYFGSDKKTFDIAFVANKYTILAVDKGYDIFIETAKVLQKQFPFTKFHVVGPFNHNDLPYKNLADNFIFYGFKDADFFLNFYQKIDVLMIPNRPFVSSVGSFDGFPLGPSFEAAISGTVLLMSDYFNENDFLVDGRDFININDGYLKIYNTIVSLIENPGKLEEIGKNGCKKYIEKYTKPDQFEERKLFFKKILDEL